MFIFPCSLLRPFSLTGGLVLSCRPQFFSLVVFCLPDWHPSGFCLPSFLFWVCLPSGLAPPWAVGFWGCFGISFCARHSWTRCLAFVFFSGLFCFILRIPGHARVRTHTLALLLSRTHSLSPAGALGPACPCGFSCGLFLLEFVPLFLCPSLSLFAQLCPSLGLLLAFGGRGGDSTPSCGCGCAAPGAFGFVCVVRFGWAGLGVSCALFSSPFVWQIVGCVSVVAERSSAPA